ncbi:PREDICTED: uncharacterized protein LOC104598846 [Nelumbo nucifera]|uniref:Transmembrane protein n=2 Tax=Nelumbo nucifera TaxID=4432 RepID=A0A822YZQ1_NELNU|nr:PREDICTED: uncharacterized protein LOC104598846 [Nelumbo nucifera]DAD38192.1 TPA_asm: hypothetical protein HUJ06_008833 [Nelumbo nucifera]
MAVTHADLASSRRSTDLGSKTGAFLLVVSILCGLLCFILCLLAETTRSDVTWMLLSSNEERRHACIYSDSGKTPLLCAGGAFLSLAIAMIVEHAYIHAAVYNNLIPSTLIALNNSGFCLSRSLSWQAGFFFLTTLMCFAVTEVILLIGLGIESGHLNEWSRPRTSCLVVREGLFSAAGVSGLTTVFLASGLYLTALRAQRLQEHEDNVRREALDASVLYADHASPPITANGAENTHVRQEYDDHPLPNRDPQPSLTLNKIMNPV